MMMTTTSPTMMIMMMKEILEKTVSQLGKKIPYIMEFKVPDPCPQDPAMSLS